MIKLIQLIPSLIICSFAATKGVTSIFPFAEKKLKYRASFGNCPSKAAGTLTLKIVKAFEKENSLKAVKSRILKEKLEEKHFVSDYKVSYSPLKKFLEIKFDCPKPLMKAQIYENNGLDFYEAILVENGQLLDPTFEVLLRAEKKLTHDLPFLALPVGEMEKETQDQITELANQLNDKFRQKISEVIVSKDLDMTIILSIKGQATSVFVGKENWSGKMDKLLKLIRHMEKKGRIPSVINLTNAKKVVVKFN